MDLLQPLPSHMRIDLRRGDIRVTKHHLNGTKVCPSFQEMTCEGVTEKMGADPFPNARIPAVPLQNFPEPLTAYPLPGTANEQETALPPLVQPLSHCLQIDR